MPRTPLPIPSRLCNTTQSPSSPVSPLTPHIRQRTPLKLHLRKSNPKAVYPDIPETPYPWIWRCHLCYSVYQLGVTRRCLEDGHYFCSVPPPPPTPISPDSPYSPEFTYRNLDWSWESPSSTQSKDERTEQESRRLQKADKKKKEKRRKKMKVHRTCTAEFDYTGWGAYNSWRAKMRDAKPRRLFRGRHNKSMKEARKERDCWRDCEFPSQCINEVQEEDTWAQMRRHRELEEEMELGPAEESEEIEFEGIASGFFDEGHSDSDSSDEEDAAINSEDGPLGVDCDGLGEMGYQLEYTKSRKKSLDGAAEREENLAKSPLQECFDFSELMNA